jgi:Fic family protein
VIFKSVRLGSEELRVIDAISQMYKRMRYALSSPARWEGSLRRIQFARGIRGSNSIEGYVASAEDALAVAEGQEPLDADRETASAIKGYRDAMTFVLQLAKDLNFTIGEGYVRALHFMMLQHDLSKNPGKWRTGPIYVRDEERKANVYEGPPADLVPRLMGELISYMRSNIDNDHALVKGAMAHLNLVMIHPFSDGNGRMGRCLHTLMLAKRGIVDPVFSSVEEYLGRRTNTRQYYDVLGKVGEGSWNPGNDTRPWIRFNITAHYRQAATVKGRMTMIAKLWDHLEKVIKEKNVPERSIYALSDAAMGYKIRSTHYKALAEVSSVVSSRDLKSLVDAGLLVGSGEKRGRFYRAAPSLSETWLELRKQEPSDIPDPFTEPEVLRRLASEP